MKNKILLILLTLLSLIPLFDLLHPGLPITHDGRDHVVRLANFYANLQEGIIVPRWSGNLNWGYGHPVLSFLYPLPSYLGSLFHMFGFTLVDSTKLVFGISFILSGLTMYLWIQSFLSKKAAFLAALLYMFAPYRFVDLYVRGAIGEHLAFIFPPLIFYSLQKLSTSLNTSRTTSLRGAESTATRQSRGISKKSLGLPRRSLLSLLTPRNDVVLGSLSFAGLILAHNITSVMFLPFIVLYILYLLFQTSNKISFLIKTTLIFIFGLATSSFFWMPAVFEAKYTLRDIVMSDTVANNFSQWTQFLYSPWSYGGSGQLTVQVGILQWLAVLASILIAFFYYYKKVCHSREGGNPAPPILLLTGAIISFITVLWLMTQPSHIVWNIVPLMQKFQYPWRFLSVALCLCSLLGAISFSQVPTKYHKPILIIVSVSILLINSPYWHPKGYLYKPETFYSGIFPGTTDTGETAPIWSIRFMEHTPKAHIEVIQGQAKITEIKRTITDHQYQISSLTKAQLRENTLFFPGWQVLIDGQPTNIQYQDPNNRGLMTFFITPGTHQIEIKFTETKLRQIADIISLITVVFLITYGLSSWLVQDLFKLRLRSGK